MTTTKVDKKILEVLNIEQHLITWDPGYSTEKFIEDCNSNSMPEPNEKLSPSGALI